MRGWCSLCLLAAGLAPACSTSTTADQIEVRIEVNANASRVSYRVWDERHQLVGNAWLDADEFPRVLRLFPDASDNTSAEYRWARVEVELWSDEGCPFARKVGTYRYGARLGEATLTIGEADRAGSPSCRLLYVDADAAGAATEGCSADQPCQTVRQAVSEGAGTDERVVVLVAGSAAAYAGFSVRESFAGDRTLEDPNVLRAWPGRPPPSISSQISMCCNNQPMNPVPQGVEIDGFEIFNGERTAIEINGASDVRVRNCHVHDSGFEDDAIDRAGLRIVGGWDIELEHNLIENNAHPTGLSPVDGVFAGFTSAEAPARFGFRIVDNRFVDNQDAGLRLFNIPVPVLVTGNSLCRNGTEGIRFRSRGSAEGRVNLLGNVVANNGTEGLRTQWEGPILVEANSFRQNASGSFLNDGPGGPALTGNILSGVDAALGEENVIDPPAEPAVIDCLVPPTTGGICATFPDCR